jgi:hypothetical protein
MIEIKFYGFGVKSLDDDCGCIFLSIDRTPKTTHDSHVQYIISKLIIHHFELTFFIRIHAICLN